MAFAGARERELGNPPENSKQQSEQSSGRRRSQVVVQLKFETVETLPSIPSGKQTALCEFLSMEIEAIEFHLTNYELNTW